MCGRVVGIDQGWGLREGAWLGGPCVDASDAYESRCRSTSGSSFVAPSLQAGRVFLPSPG